MRLIFFFSSRRRHTRYIGDWSSDVCSSDLTSHVIAWRGRARHHRDMDTLQTTITNYLRLLNETDAERRATLAEAVWADRSEERRVGKECRARWSAYH